MPSRRPDRATTGRNAFLAIAGGAVAFAISAAWAVLDRDVTGSGDAIPYQVGFAARLATAVLLITGISALHRIQRPWTRGLANAGYVLLIGSLLVFAIVFSSFWVLGWLGFHLGAVVFGFGILRAGILSRVGGWLLAAGTPVIFGVGLIADRREGATGSPVVFAGTAVVLLGLMWLALSEARRRRFS